MYSILLLVLTTDSKCSHVVVYVLAFKECKVSGEIIIKNKIKNKRNKIKWLHSILSPFKACIYKSNLWHIEPQLLKKCFLYDNNIGAPIKTPVKKISNKYSMRGFDKVRPILKCHRVFTVGLVRYKNKTCRGRF